MKRGTICLYTIRIYNFKKVYLLEELIKVFLRPDMYIMIPEKEEMDIQAVKKTDFEKKRIEENIDNAQLIEFNKNRSDDRNQIKREIYTELSKITGKKPAWGILTGIRPVKLFGEIFEKTGNINETMGYMRDTFMISEEKLSLIRDMYLRQKDKIGFAEKNSAGVYIGIPFCPTRCVYCSFASNQVEHEEIEEYLKALLHEVREMGTLMKQNGTLIETIYIGGGTPTTLKAEEMDLLLTCIEESFDLKHLKEFTVEAGRPDTITLDKLKVIQSHNVDRISINPQSMKQETLDRIGRNHSPEDIVKAFEMAKMEGFPCINADIIAGLPGEEPDDFMDTLKQVRSMNPENITVHSLTVKRASRLKDIDPEFHYNQGEKVEKMLNMAQEYLIDEGYLPYYLYRQKNMSGALENTGYAKPGTESIYNMRIMDEHQTIIALGAGGISKAYDFENKSLKRVPHVVNYREYIERTDEMIMRKRENIFTEV